MTPREMLEALLAETVESADERQRTTFDRLAGERASGLVLFGAGALGRDVLRRLRTLGMQPLAFADNDPGLLETSIDGVPVLHPSDAATRFGGRATFVVTTMCGCVESGPADAIRTQLLSSDRSVVAVPAGYLFWKHPDTFMPFFFVAAPRHVIEQREQVLAAFELLGDEASRLEYVDQVRCRATLVLNRREGEFAPDQYFPADLVEARGEDVFVDCGAYDGDTVIDFVDRGGGKRGGVIAFEPDPVTFGRLQASVASLPPETRVRVTLHQAGVASTTGTLRFSADATESSSFTDAGDAEVDCVRLDDAVAGSAVTYVKMDVEGAELDALEGARELIRTRAPVLAVSAYHRLDHLWKVPLLIHEIRPDYRLYLRPHRDACWDTVCYAIPVRRGV